MFIHPFLPSLDSTSLHPSQCILSAPWVAYSAKWLPYTVPKVAITYSTWSGYHIMYTKQTTSWHSARHSTPFRFIVQSTPMFVQYVFRCILLKLGQGGGRGPRETSRTSDLTFGAKFTETRKQIFNYKHANRTKYKYLIQSIYSKTFKKKS